MLVCVPTSKLLALVAALGFASAAMGTPETTRPSRVVSVNLCTDQLAIALAAPGQLLSVSYLAHDPDISAEYEAALAYPSSRAKLEQVYLQKPDLVLAGTFSDPVKIAALKSLGIRVELFEPARALDQVPDRIRRMGDLLGRQEAAEAMIRTYEAELATLVDAPANRPRAALYYANSYTSGEKTLAGDILHAAGFDNIASELGRGGTLPLEQLVMLSPDVIITGRDYRGQARAEDNLVHPALDAMTGTLRSEGLADKDWICGTPHVLNAIRTMRGLRDKVESSQ